MMAPWREGFRAKQARVFRYRAKVAAFKVGYNAAQDLHRGREHNPFHKRQQTMLWRAWDRGFMKGRFQGLAMLLE